jgi:hypothetical protein
MNGDPRATWGGSSATEWKHFASKRVGSISFSAKATAELLRRAYGDSATQQR